MTNDEKQDPTNLLARENLKAWESKPFLEKITGLVPNIIYIFNQQTQSNEYSNRSIGEALGYSTAEVLEMGDALIPSLCHPDDLQQVFEHFQAIQRLSDDQVLNIEYRMKHQNGRWVWLLSHDCVFERDSSGEVLRHIGSAFDITRQKEAQDNALATTRELRNFAYSVSHDLKSPSNTLAMLFSELEHEMGDKLDEDATELMGMAQKTIKRMQGVINDVSTYTNVLSSNTNFEKMNLNDVIDEVISDLKSQIVECSGEITVTDLPDIEGNRTQIRQLFQNLISNALKYRKTNQIPVINIFNNSISTLAGARTCVGVSDNGIGMPEESHERIFDIFSRLHNSTEYAGSSGLGLAICKRIALTHNAEISVESSVGKGSTFTVSFN